MNLRSKLIISMALVGSLGALAGCGRDGSSPLAAHTVSGIDEGGLASNSQPIVLPFDAANFTQPVPNSYFPLVPGTVSNYVSTTDEGVETNLVRITDSTKVILGVTTRVVRDQVWLDGTLIEDTFDWYAGDNSGNVWYLGEDTKSFHDGQTSTTGSWEAGKDGASAGIIMLAHPEKGDTYQQENSPGVVEDMARVVSLDETVTVPYGTFDEVLKTIDWTPLEPGNRELKYYARDFGVVLEIGRHGGRERVELVDHRTP